MFGRGDWTRFTGHRPYLFSGDDQLHLCYNLFGGAATCPIGGAHTIDLNVVVEVVEDVTESYKVTYVGQVFDD